MDLPVDEIEKRVLELVEKRYKDARYKKDLELHMDTDVRRDLEFDSIMLLVLQIDIEDEFHIRFNPVEEDTRLIFTTIRNISAYVQRRLEENI